VRGSVPAAQSDDASASDVSRIAFASSTSVPAGEKIDAIRAQNTYTQQAQIIVPCDNNGNFGMSVYDVSALEFKLMIYGYFVD